MNLSLPTRREIIASAAALAALRTPAAQAAGGLCGNVADAPAGTPCKAWVVETITDLSVTSWTVPAGVTAIQVEGWGGGAGGSTLGGAGGDQPAGGGGAWMLAAMFAVTPGQVFSLQVGAGGGPGEDGQPTTFGTILLAPAGLADGTAGSEDDGLPTPVPIQSDLPPGWGGGDGGTSYAVTSVANNGAGGGSAGGPRGYGGYGGDNIWETDDDSPGGGAAGENVNSGPGLPNTGGISTGAMSWSWALGGAAEGGAGTLGSGGGGGPVGGAGGLGVGWPTGGPGGGGGGGSTGAGGPGKWGAGGGAGRPGGSGGNGAIAISYVSPGDDCNKVITSASSYNIAVLDEYGFIYYSTDSGATWTQTSVYPAEVDGDWFTLPTGRTDSNYGKWMAHAFSSHTYTAPAGGWNYGAVAVAATPLTNLQTVVPVKWQNFVLPGASLANDATYSPNTGKVFIANFGEYNASAGVVDNNFMRYSVDDGVTWQDMTAMPAAPWSNFASVTGELVSEGWHGVCISKNAQIIYVKEWGSIIRKSTDEGMTWGRLPTGPAFSHTADSKEMHIECSEDGQTVACFSRFEMELWVSHDGGTDWIRHYPYQWLYDWIGGKSLVDSCYGIDFSMSIDGQVLLLDLQLYPADISSSHNWWHKFYVSKNGGLTWTEVFPPTAQISDPTVKPASDTAKISQDGSGIFVAYENFPDTTHSFIDISTDCGATWNTHSFLVATGARGYYEDSTIWN